MEDIIVMSAGYWVRSCVILTHGCQYGCPLHNFDGVWKFKFKGKWHNLMDYVVEETIINDKEY